MSKDNNRVLGHAADNDGIDEYDNPLPDWWLAMFIFCILWAIGYGIEYHFISHRSQADAYEQEVAAAKERWPAQAVAAVDLSPATVAAGKEVYAQNCAACHQPDMTGKIGPNLIDQTWIHGGSYTEIRTTITNGVPEKGMLTWGPILGPEKVAQVAAFVYTSGPQQGIEPPPAPKGE